MQKYVLFVPRKQQKLQTLRHRQTEYERLRKCIMVSIKALHSSRMVSESACRPLPREVAVTLVAPALKQKVEQNIEVTKSARADLVKRLEFVNSELEDIKARIRRLESKEYEQSIIDAAVKEAQQYVDMVTKAYIQRHEALHSLLDRRIKELEQKQQVTVQDLRDISEDLEEVAEATPELPRGLLEEIRSFEPGTLKAVEEETESEPVQQFRDELMQALMKRLSEIRQATQPEEETAS